MNKVFLILGVLSIAILTGCKKDITPSDDLQNMMPNQVRNGADENATEEFVPNEILIKFKIGATEKGRANALARIGGNEKEHVVTAAMKAVGDNEGFHVLRIPGGVLVAIERLQGLADVEFAEPNYILRHIPLSHDNNPDADDPYYTSTSENIWGMFGQLTTPIPWKYGSRAGEAWTGASGKDANGTVLHNLPPQIGSDVIYVGVIDEGIDYNHEDLAGQVGNPLELSGTIGIDDDSNGKVDDFYGWNFVNNNNNVYAGVEDDHGTHVAGTIGAIRNNAKGVAGVSPKIRMISAKFLGPNGGTTDAAIKAIDYLTDSKRVSKYNIVATNNSWGGGRSSSLLQAAIGRSEEQGILFVAAAGNDNINIDKRLSYPACYPNANIISVGSIQLNSQKSGFSNYGVKNVDLFAPGSHIWSTTPNNTYSKYSGTSMATPHVTGAVALYAASKGWTNVSKAQAVEIKDQILKSARPTITLKGLSVTSARLDVHSAWQNIDNRSLIAD